MRISANPRPLLAVPAFMCIVLLETNPHVANAQSLTVVHSFQNVGGSPYAGLTEGPGGVFYGTTAGAGLWGHGSVFALTPDGSSGYVFSTLYSFTGGADGASPLGGLVLANDGNLYGTTDFAGVGSGGTAFRIDTSGNLTTLHQFEDYGDGFNPVANLIQASDGNLYGVTESGGGNGTYGTVYRMDLNGNETVIHAFGGGSGGAFPKGALLQGPDGMLYGTTSQGGPGGGNGTIYQINPADESFTTIHVFNGTDGDYSTAALVLGPDGYFYGTTEYGSGGGTIFRADQTGLLQYWPVTLGPAAPLVTADDGNLYGTGNLSVVFRFTTAGEVTVLHTFSGPDGSNLLAPLIQASDGLLYGTTVQGGLDSLGTVFRLDTSGGSFSSIYQFVGNGPSRPVFGLLQAPDQRIYGTAGGGTLNEGTVFRLGLDGSETVLKSFTGPDGSFPTGLLRAPTSALFGTTSLGGDFNLGTVFEIDPSGVFSPLHSFSSEEGSSPIGLTLASDGSLLGATYEGHIVVYRIDALGVFSVLHALTDSECREPLGTFVESGGAFSGVCYAGGASDQGSVIRFDEGSGFSVLHSFSGWDGSNPSTPLTLAPDGSLYGTTSTGGAGGAGVIFRVEPNGKTTALASLDAAKGGPAAGALLVGPDGNLYGVSLFGGSQFLGGVFRSDPSGNATLIYSFSGGDGHQPNSQPFLGVDGDLYGATLSGGLFNGGDVFRLSLPQELSIWTMSPTSGPAAGGTSATVTGFNFKTSPSVMIGGIAATNVVTTNPTELTFQVPALSPGTLNDIVVTNYDGIGGMRSRLWMADFLDVSQDDPFHTAVERIFRFEVTAGCGGGNYCRNSAIARTQMAVFLLKAEHGPGYAPPACTGIFGDVACPSQFADWVEELANEGITAGCGGGNYCPNGIVTRAQMAVFLLRAEHGSAYVPPACSGIFQDVTCPSPFADWIEQLYAEGVTGGCQAAPLEYCPDNANTRGQMAVLMTKAFQLP